MTKQEVIQKAYGSAWEKVKNCVDDNGVFRANNPYEHKPEHFGFKISDVYLVSSLNWMPKSLLGIQNNNGWIKIESEADLPKEDGTYYIVCNGKVDVYNFIRERTEDDIREVEYWLSETTHYQPIIKPKPPIY